MVEAFVHDGSCVIIRNIIFYLDLSANVASLYNVTANHSLTNSSPGTLNPSR